MKHLLTIFAAVLISVGCSKNEQNQTDTTPKPDTLVQDFDEAEMDAAIATAKSRVDEFLQALEANEADSFSVKAPIQDGDQTEHFWIVNISFKDGVFSGAIGNDPGIVKNVTAGQAWEIKKDDISDWMYTKSDRIHGGFTIDPLLKTFPKEKADKMREMLVR